MAIFLLAARCVIVCVFLRAGLAKVVNLADFRAAVANYQLLPRALVPVAAVCLPFAELAAAILLAAGIVPAAVAGLLALLLTAFAAAIAVNLARGRVFDCGCTGTAPQTIGWTHVGSNLVLAALAVTLALAPAVALAAPPRADVLPIVLAVLLCLALVTVLRRAAAVPEYRVRSL